MISPALQTRCETLRQPIIDLAQSGVVSVGKPDELRTLIPRIAAVAAILDQGTDGIVEESYLQWHAIARDTLRKMDAAARDDDAVEAWRLFRDPVVGFAPVGQACAGVTGW